MLDLLLFIFIQIVLILGGVCYIGTLQIIQLPIVLIGSFLPRVLNEILSGIIQIYIFCSWAAALFFITEIYIDIKLIEKQWVTWIYHLYSCYIVRSPLSFVLRRELNISPGAKVVDAGWTPEQNRKINIYAAMSLITHISYIVFFFNRESVMFLYEWVSLIINFFSNLF